MSLNIIYGSGASGRDASLHSLAISDSLTLNPGFDSERLSYNVTLTGTNIFTITITVANGAAVKYTNGVHTNEDVSLDPATYTASFQADLTIDLLIKVVARDGVTTRTYTISSGPPVLSNDASLHSLVIGVPITQNDVGYTASGFTPNCLHYTAGAGMLVPITVTADAGAAIKYTSAGGPVTLLPQNTATMVNLPLTITVTAADGVTTRTYTFV